jgi:outer membrane receptor for ferrienterochelin and colicins
LRAGVLLVLPVFWAIAVQAEEEEKGGIQSIVITATRSNALVRDEPRRVEVVPDEEIKESLTVAPGNLSNLLNELAGARMQSSAPGLGGMSIQLRGLPGRHAQILSDGLPIAGAQTGSFSVMQTPPFDLARVEVIKGAASALYGGSALAGVLNLVSRPPGGESEVLLNQTSSRGTDAVAFLSQPLSKSFGYTAIGGAHYQSREDRDHDGWSDLPGYKRGTLRPRFYWNEGEERSVFATFGLMQEDRTGGTLPGRTLPGGGEFAQELRTRRVDGGAVARFSLADEREMNIRWSATQTEHDRVFGATRVIDDESSVLGEASLHGKLGQHKVIVGAALQYERLHTRDVEGVSFDYTVPGLFIQDEYSPAEWISIAGSARIDAHSDYGTFFSPQLALLFRAGDAWSLRASAGTGFAAPTPLIEDVQARSLAVLNPLGSLRSERASTVSLDGKWAEAPWDVNLSVFASEIRHPLDVREAPGNRLDLINSAGPLRARGAEALIGYSSGPLHILTSITTLDVTELSPEGGRRDADLIPKFSAEIATILEDEDRGRVGVEIGYTGRQALSDNPYRTESRTYIEINALAELKLGDFAIFLNAHNLTDVRQTDYDPLLRPVPGPGGDPITDVWAPLIGRNFNIGIRAEL